MTNESLQEQITNFHIKIAAQLISLTPEHWIEIFLTVENTGDGEELSMAHTITSPEGHKDVAAPDKNLFALTRELYLLQKQNGEDWSKMSFRVFRDEDNEWQFDCEYEYKD